MSGLYQDEFVAELQAGLTGITHHWGLGPETELSLLNLSENATFLARDASRDTPVVFRVHRPGYHEEDEIASELDWISALRDRAVVDTPAILSRSDGARIGRFDHHGTARHVVAFAHMTGTEPDPEGDLTEGFRQLGAISARLHGHVRDWAPAPGFRRKTWDWDSAFGAAPLWGDWRAALGLDAEGRALLERLAERLRDRCDRYGAGQDRFGLVHADLRLANLLQDGARLGVIDFDDCGFSWFVYDFAAAISFLETAPGIPALADAWVAGYRSVAPLSAEHVAMIPTFVLFRRLLLTAWIASHSETETAEWAGLDAYTAGTLDLAETYLGDETALPGAA